MTNKKRPGLLRKGVAKSTIDNVAAKVQAAQLATTQEYETKSVPLSKIHIWDDQPRTLALTLDDVKRGSILSGDPDYDIKHTELMGIISLALSIREFGMLYQPLAYALPGQEVQLMGGQRRVMASIFSLFHIVEKETDSGETFYDVQESPAPDSSLLETTRIEIKVFSKKPDVLNLERISMADNMQRKGLPIGDRLKWAVNFANIMDELGEVLSWKDLASTLALNRSQAFEWKKIIDNRQDTYIRRAIELVSNETLTLNQLVELAGQSAKKRKALLDSWLNKSPAPDSKRKVSLGTTTNLNALKSLIMANIDASLEREFESVDWGHPSQVKKAFKKFMSYWESVNG